ncbi:hypothetical protein [Herbaspirillum rubrisubalbicans]|uniref:hypothetical protein n=1 Tax=Herbaspirillum rubrisubalbicans TaxID=80842 RepID=UPI0015C532F5|nr:hypothetical protein [Herbaspirillum rubrisubalbicans]NQE51366.1 hypothetical protein [Herbaspirillum rubrisubalbicans]
MNESEKSKLIEVYRRYGFTLAEQFPKEGILVFTLKTGYFDNAEIVRFSTDVDASEIFKQFTAIGFACTIRDAVAPGQAEHQLFKGFFSVDSTRKRLLEEYKKFSAKLVASYGKTAKYEYIKAPYQINGKDGLLSPPEEVLKIINDPEPILVLIEAAAGFGKTCTALEIVKLLAEGSENLPLYAELSRNRQARIFRYILLDEIDRSFPLLSSNLVQTEIENGRVATILDGFDELLRKNEETGDFENKEPMLETVSELLKGSAKVIITTRRTVLFDGDEFHQWLDKHAESFRVVRIRIQEPKVGDWLADARLERLGTTGLNIHAIANPVLLSYLRCIDDSDFEIAAQKPESIVESYFEYMLEREKERQDLRMKTTDQGIVLEKICEDMMKEGYTAESREYFIEFILNNLPALIDEARSQYSSKERPSRDEIANKLATHALLDRSANDPAKMSFINEFVLGHYAAAHIIKNKDWIGDDMRFIEPAARSYSPRSKESKQMLFDRLKESLPYWDISSQIDISTQLCNSLPEDISEAEADGLTLDNIEIGKYPITNFIFNECIFKNCVFYPKNLSEVTFLNCKFYDSRVDASPHAGAVYVLGCVSTPDISKQLEKRAADEPDTLSANMERDADIVILRKFWPVGEDVNLRPSRPVHRPLKYLCTPTGGFTSGELFKRVERLIEVGIFIEHKSRLIRLNYENLSMAQDILKACR